MVKVDSELTDVTHDVAITRGVPLWPAIEQAIIDGHIDLIVIGTHGRTRAQRLLWRIFCGGDFQAIKRAGTDHRSVHKNLANKGAFHSVLFATDFSKHCEIAAPFAVSLAEENDARLILLYVAAVPGTSDKSKIPITYIMEGLHQIVPGEARMRCRPVAMVKYGEAAERILEVAAEREADVIVLGVRSAAGHLGAATHLERQTAGGGCWVGAWFLPSAVKR